MTLVLMPVPESQWREPSQAQPKDQFGNANQTRFRLTARLNDGFVRWRGWFDSRDDADAFLYALALNIIDGTPVPVEMWRLPSPWWHPDIGEELTYDFATVVILSAPTGSLQSWTVAVDWWNSSNKAETIGGGASGGVAWSAGTRPTGTGGGGGAWNTATNISISTLTVSYQIAATASAVAISGSGSTNGNNGGQTWFNGANLGASSVGSVGGSLGTGAVSGSAQNGGAGGVGSSGVGSSSQNGGRGGNISASINAAGTGGGGAAGLNGAGAQGGDATTATATTGGNGDAGSGGAGSAGSFNAGGSATASAGGNGTEYTTAGSGGGGGGAGANNAATAGAGGNYGAGGGGAISAGGGGAATSGAGNQGLIALTYTPFKRGAFLAFF